MKFSKWLIPIMLLTSSIQIFAQSGMGDSDPQVSGSLGKPAGINLIKLLSGRFHALEIGARAFEMNNDNVSERAYVATFNASGALLYHHEMIGHDINKIAGKNAGMQLLPYSVTISEDGRVFVSVSGFSFKNMITASAGKVKSPLLIHNDASDNPLWSVIDNIELLTYEYDRESEVDGVTSHSLKFLSMDSKLDILNVSKKGGFLAITGGADIGMTKFNNSTIRVHNGYSNAFGFHASLRYGLEGSLEHKGWRLNARGRLENAWSSTRAKNGTQNDYGAENYDKVTRAQFLIVPSINISKKVTSQESRPVRVGLGAYSNIILRDEFTGTQEVDLSLQNREKFGMKLFVNF